MNGSSNAPPDVSSRISLTDPDICRRDPVARTPGFFARGPLACVDGAVLRDLRALATREGGAARLSLHRDPGEALHEMLILQRSDRFFPPKRHPHKAKSFVIVEGRLLVAVFDDEGRPLDARVLEPGGALSYRVAAGYFHVDLPMTETAVHLEYTLGPFTGVGDREMAPWGPPLGDADAGDAFRVRLLEMLGLSAQKDDPA